MYRGFNLMLDKIDFWLMDEKKIAEYENRGKKRLEYLHDNVVDILKEHVSEGIIDGTELSKTWFKCIKTDVFLSHSHNDAKLALLLAGWLEKNMGINVFLDEVIWGSADKLLKAIDDEYCISDINEDTYDYKKRNLSTSHVHAMLSVAMFDAIDKAEVVFFINTENSVPKIEDSINTRNHTLSPWIYEEIVATKLIRKREWEEHRIVSIMEDYTEKQLKVSYKIPLEDLTEINMEDLDKWNREYIQSKASRNRYGGLLEKNPDHPLNYLYSTKFGFKEDNN